MENRTPNPGSIEAGRLGCLCAVMDNCNGRGRGGDGEKFGWYINGDCPLHADPLPEGGSFEQRLEHWYMVTKAVEKSYSEYTSNALEYQKTFDPDTMLLVIDTLMALKALLDFGAVQGGKWVFADDRVEDLIESFSRLRK